MRRNIVLDIDVLLDTRAGTLRRIIPLNEVEALINTETYRNRTHDRMWELCSITQQQWEDGWALRDEITLAHSLPSLATVDMTRMLSDINNVVAGNNPGLSDVLFLVNTYPYKIREENKARIASAVQYNLSTTCDVQCMSLDNSRLSPQQCKDRNIIMMMIYDIMKYNQDCFPDDVNWSMDNLPTPNEELTIITPMIDRNFLDSKDEIENLGVVLPKGIDNFTITSELFQLIYSLEFVNTSYVCEVTAEVRERIKAGMDKAAKEEEANNPQPSDEEIILPQPTRQVRRK